MKRKDVLGPPVHLSWPYILNLISNRCSICEECGEKTHWLGARNGSGVFPIRIRGKYCSVRRLIYERHHRVLDATEKVVTKCENQRCINPKLLGVITMKDVVHKALAEGKIANRAIAAKIAATKRASSRVDDQAVAEMIADHRSAPRVAAEKGVSSSYVRAVRSGRLRALGRNLFAGLGAR